MTKQAFMHAMSKELSGLPKEERQDILMEYDVHFAEGLKAGKTEEQITAELGSPRELAKMYRVDALIQQAQTNVSTNNIMRAVLATIGLGLLNLILVVGPFVGILGIIVGIFGISIGFVVGGLILFVSAVFGPLSAPWLHIPGIMVIDPMITAPVGIGLFALGLLIFMFGIICGRFTYQMTLRYLRFNLRIVRGR